MRPTRPGRGLVPIQCARDFAGPQPYATIRSDAMPWAAPVSGFGVPEKKPRRRGDSITFIANCRR